MTQDEEVLEETIRLLRKCTETSKEIRDTIRLMNEDLDEAVKKRPNYTLRYLTCSLGFIVGFIMARIVGQFVIVTFFT